MGTDAPEVEGTTRRLYERPPPGVWASNALAQVKVIWSPKAETLRLPGAERLRRALPPPALRVRVDADAASFASQGKNVFAKFVLDCDPGLRPGDETLVVDERDSLVAVGRAFMVREEMLAFRKGMAVRVRQGASSRGGDDGAEGN